MDQHSGDPVGTPGLHTALMAAIEHARGLGDDAIADRLAAILACAARRPASEAPIAAG